MLRIGDKVRPTKDWYKDYIDRNYPLFCDTSLPPYSLLPTDQQIDKYQQQDIGIVSRINGEGVEGTEVSVEWIKTNKHKILQPKNAWWEEKELEVISRNNVYSK